jgi:hypothetical protein
LSASSFSNESVIDAVITGEAAGIAGAGLANVPFAVALVDWLVGVFGLVDF